MKSVIRQFLLHAVVPLVAGFLIYFFLRPNIWFVEFFEKREPMISLAEMNRFQRLLIFSGPDFCWAYSLSSALFIWHKWQNRISNHFAYFVFFLVILSELLQFLLPSKFTLDWFDVIAAILAFALSYLLICRNAKN